MNPQVSALRLLMLLGASGAALTGCREESPPATTGKPPQAANSGSRSGASDQAPGAANADSDSGITVLDAGREPRAALRYKTGTEEVQLSRVTMKVAADTTMDNQPTTSSSAPPLILSLQTTTRAPDSAGDIVFAWSVADATVADDPAFPAANIANIAAEIGTLRGIAGAGTLTDHGVLRRAEFQPPATLPEATRQTLLGFRNAVADLWTPFPDKPIGQGARWQIRRNIQVNAMAIAQVIEAEVTDIGPGTVTLRLTNRQTAGKQKMPNAGAGSGVEVELVSLTGESTGEVTVDLKRAVPTSGKLSGEMRLAMDQSSGGKSARVEQVIRLKTEVGQGR